MEDHIRESIASTKREFEASFASGSFYDRQTQDPGHLDRILRSIKVGEGMKVLDLGTGSGYLSFAIARSNKGCSVTGLDILTDTLGSDRIKAKAEGLENLTFVSYDGSDFPFGSGSFDLIVTRYSLHHFPDIGHSIGEAARVLKPGGRLFISDPCPNDCDKERFVDDYMRLKKDGHIKFYTKDELCSVCGRYGLEYEDSFETVIRFPRKKDTMPGHEDVLRRHGKAVTESYLLTVTDSEIYITERVNNIFFVKDKR